jgi:putative ABC transport system permease protein
MIGKYLPLLASSLRRKRLRTFFTIASILIAFLLYGLAASLQFALKSGVDVAGADRLLTARELADLTGLAQGSVANLLTGWAREGHAQRLGNGWRSAT